MKFLTLTLIATICLTLAGCAPTPPATVVAAPPSEGTPTPRQRLACLTLLAADRSKSTEEIRNLFMSTTFDIGTSFDQQKDAFRLFRFGHNTEEMYSQLPLDDDDFAMILAKNLKESDPMLGTDYAGMLETLADAAESTTEPTVRIVIVGDGQNDFKGNPAYDARYRAAAARLAKCSRVKLVRFWGADTGTREEIRSVLKPLADRLQIMSLDQDPIAP